MSGRRRPQQSKGDKEPLRTSADQGRSAVEPDEEVSAGPSASAKAPKATKRSKGRKAVVSIAAPAVISGLAGGVPPVAIDAVQQAVHAITADYAASYKPSPSGGEYVFGKEWQGSSGYQAAAVKMATQVVEIAVRKAGRRDCDAASKHRYIQWILAGDMTPAEAAQVLAQGRFERNIKPLRKLIRLIREEHPVSIRHNSAMTNAVITSQIVNRPPR